MRIVQQSEQSWAGSKTSSRSKKSVFEESKYPGSLLVVIARKLIVISINPPVTPICQYGKRGKTFTISIATVSVKTTTNTISVVGLFSTLRVGVLSIRQEKAPGGCNSLKASLFRLFFSISVYAMSIGV